MNTIATVEFEPTTYEWLVEFSKREEGLSFSEGMNRIMQLGIKVATAEMSLPDEMPKAQKLLLQCTMENWLILKEAFVKEPQYQMDIQTKARHIIQKTLGLEKAPSPEGA